MESVLFCILPALAASLTVPAVMGQLRRNGAALHPVFVWLTWVLPFAAGGFYTYMAVPVSALLLWFLWQRLRERKYFRFFRNRASISVLALAAGYALTPLWAADKGMAPFGLIRFLPVLLLVLLLMQLDEEERHGMLCLVPVTGAVMTVLSLGLLLIPGLSGFLSVNGRLAGFFQYPNTFALFLLAGLIVHQQKEAHGWAASALDGALMLGIFLSGSRTAFLLFLFSVAVILLRRRNMKTALRFSGLSLVSGGIALAISRLGLLDGASRLSSISVSSGTFLARLLYFRDALSVIPTHPFGAGYWGWRAMQGSIQTGRYSVSFIHNGLLQLLMDVGWVPTLLLAWCFLGLLLGKQTPWHKRLLLAAVLGHCVLDFDMQFLAVWVILISQMDLTEGKCFSFHKIQRLGAVAGAFLLGISLWLGIADVCMQAGAVNACLSVTPFHTQALTQSLKKSPIRKNWIRWQTAFWKPIPIPALHTAPKPMRPCPRGTSPQ